MSSETVSQSSSGSDEAERVGGDSSPEKSDSYSESLKACPGSDEALEDKGVEGDPSPEESDSYSDSLKANSGSKYL